MCIEWRRSFFFFFQKGSPTIDHFRVCLGLVSQSTTSRAKRNIRGRTVATLEKWSRCEPNTLYVAVVGLFVPSRTPHPEQVDRCVFWEGWRQCAKSGPDICELGLDHGPVLCGWRSLGKHRRRKSEKTQGHFPQGLKLARETVYIEHDDHLTSHVSGKREINFRVGSPFCLESTHIFDLGSNTDATRREGSSR